MAGVIRYIIDMDEDQVRTATGLLNGAGIGFDPTENMIAMPRNNLEESIFTGRDGEYAREGINELLQETNEMHRINQPFHDMRLTAQRDLLTLATLHCEWVKGRVRNC